jgi:hypothetical protein
MAAFSYRLSAISATSRGLNIPLRAAEAARADT